MGSKLPSAVSVLLVLLVVLISGCTLSRGKSASSADTTAASALVRDAPGVPGNFCITNHLQCTSGYRVLSVKCTSGYNYTEPCPEVNSGPWAPSAS